MGLRVKRKRRQLKWLSNCATPDMKVRMSFDMRKEIEWHSFYIGISAGEYVRRAVELVNRGWEAAPPTREMAERARLWPDYWKNLKAKWRRKNSHPTWKDHKGKFERRRTYANQETTSKGQVKGEEVV